MRKSDDIKIAIFTTTDTFSEIGNILCKNGDERKIVCCIVPINRMGQEKINNVIRKCLDLGIEVLWQPLKKDVQEFNDKLIRLGVNMGVSWSYSQIIQPSTLDLFKYGIWNMHGGKIPEYRGANVLQWAIVNGESELGVTWHMMDEEVDAGEILSQGIVEISNNENALDVREKIFSKGIELFEVLWKEFSTTGIKPYMPELGDGKSYRQRNILDGLITNDMSLEKAQNLMRAQCPPWPAPIVKINNAWYDVLSIELTETENGYLYNFLDDKAYLVLKHHNNPEEDIEKWILKMKVK